MPLLLASAGGCIGFVSALCSGWFTHVLNRRAERLTKRREMLQLLAVVAHEISCLPEEYEGPDQFQVWKNHYLARSRNLVNIAYLYLPQLRQPASQLVQAGRQCVIAFARLNEAAGQQGAALDGLKETRLEKINGLDRAWKRLMDDVGLLAAEYGMSERSSLPSTEPLDTRLQDAGDWILK